MVKQAPTFIFMPPTRVVVLKPSVQVAGFSGVIGCIDGSLIPIVAPHEDEFAYVNRKNFIP